MKRINIILIAFPVLLLFTHCNKESAAGPSGTGVGVSTALFTIAGNYLYVVNSTSLKAFDISNPAAAPVLKSTTSLGINIETIFPYQDKLFIGSSSSMYIYSLDDPAKPRQLAKADYVIRFSCDPVVAKDSTAYATLRATGRCGFNNSALVVYDIKDITKPVLKREISLAGPYGLGISDTALYVCEGSNGLKVFNTRNTYSPEFVRTLTGDTFYDVIPYGNILICQVETGIVLYDISVRHQPVFLSRIVN
jgi:hypothetical protein